MRAICTDIDGTLLDSRRELSSKTIEVIQHLGGSIPVILASSRMPAAMRHLQRSLGIIQYPLICYNGGYVIRYDTDERIEALFTADIAWDTCNSILKLCADTSVHVSLYHNDQWFAPKMDEWTVREGTITKVWPVQKSGEEVLALWGQAGHGAHKIMIMGDAAEIAYLENTLRTGFGDKVHIYHSKSTYLEIAPKTVSKATALQLVLSRYDLTMTEVMAFGDNYNDIEMLQQAGLGIAVANARPEVKAVADEITLDSKQDGVADAIYRYVLSNSAAPKPFK
ncbi:MAG TPA: Cof-type HAD-IIB family hydrolase [Chryseolinea sp.]